MNKLSSLNIIYCLIVFSFFGCKKENSHINIKKAHSDYIIPDSIFTAKASKPVKINWDELSIVKPSITQEKSSLKFVNTFSVYDSTNYSQTLISLDSTHIETYYINGNNRQEIIPDYSKNFPSIRTASSPKEKSIKFSNKENSRSDIQYFGVNEGLEVDFIGNSIVDNDDFIWFSTYGGGLLKFDGHNLYNFNTNHGLTSNFVNTIRKDSKGNIWILTNDNDFLKYDGYSFYNYRYSKDNSKSFLDVKEFSNGEIYFATSKGINILNPKTNSFYKLKLLDEIDNHMVRRLIVEDDKLWILSKNGLFSYQKKCS